MKWVYSIHYPTEHTLWKVHIKSCELTQTFKDKSTPREFPLKKINAVYHFTIIENT